LGAVDAALFDYHLPEGMIAQQPAEPRDSSRLMVLSRDGVGHHTFTEFPSIIPEGALLVVNETRVRASLLHGHKETGGKASMLLVEEVDGRIRALVTAKKLREGTVLLHGDDRFTVDERAQNGWWLRSEKGIDSFSGDVPFPPYVKNRDIDPDRYQTVYASAEGSVAAPTAGLHFTDDVFAGLKERGVEVVKLEHRVGPGTFLPVKVDDVTAHPMEEETYLIPEATASAFNSATEMGRPVIPVGTTCMRALESTILDGRLETVMEPRSTGLYIYPGYSFRYPYAGFLTNFHLPRSTPLLLTSAFLERERILSAYEEAVREGYRFYSFGDAMLILK